MTTGDKTHVPMRRVEARSYPATTIVLPCSRCGQRRPTVSMYLEAAANENVIEGYYPSLSIRLCDECLTGAMELLKEEP